MKKILTLFLAASLALPLSADEGMWLLPLLEKTCGKALREAGCRLTPDEIYSVNHSSLKDAIVQFGGGCTGEMISDEGLLVTNHHCGRGSIQSLSTDEHNYLMNGYWALSRAEEIPVPGLKVTFLVGMEDVTDAMLSTSDPEAQGRELTGKAMHAHPDCRVSLTSFYNDNVYYLILYKEYSDIRFVGAPPADLGRFGGETDNWMWPRHTADFSMFRIYADADGQPADYAPDNVPYHPQRFLKVSLKGVEQGDYTMVMGYPGRTQRFQTAAQLEQMLALNRIRIDARTIRQDIMWEAMCADPSVQLKYANKFASSSNGWKKWQGEELSFDKLDIIGRELRKEQEFSRWVNKKSARKARYGAAIGQIRDAIAADAESDKALTLLTEAPWRIELVTLASMHVRNPRSEAMDNYYRDYVEALDRREAEALLRHYREQADPSLYPVEIGGGFDFATMEIEEYVSWLFAGSAFTSRERYAAASDEQLAKDPAMQLYAALVKVAHTLYARLSDGESLRKASTAFGAGLLEWQKKTPSYPDANFTMRLTYGHVMPYSPRDAVTYHWFTTLDGLFEKWDSGNPDYNVPEAMVSLYQQRDFGPYADADGRIRTCFITNNDITGGNSGSPVLDADGNLIGLAFDGNWESMSSDVMFEPQLQRCICVDIRYVLFCVDKLGGAHHIIDELTFVK